MSNNTFGPHVALIVQVWRNLTPPVKMPLPSLNGMRY